MKSLVTGGAGFIGSHLCEALLKEGNDVICVDNFSSGNKKNIRDFLFYEKFVLYEIDVTNKEALDKVFEKEMPDYVFHLAANSDIQASTIDPEIEYKNTYTSTFRVLSSMRSYGIKKLFFTSTSAVYGNKDGILLTEKATDLSPISYYGAAKLGSQELINAFSYMNEIKVEVNEL